MLLRTVFTLLVLTGLASCDAFLTLPYMIENRTSNTVKLKVSGFPVSGPYTALRHDTIIDLPAGGMVRVGIRTGIGFPWEARKIYREQKSHNNFVILKDDSVIRPDSSEQRWKYRRGTSVFKLRDRDLR